jgi:hypothetical protein
VTFFAALPLAVALRARESRHGMRGRARGPAPRASRVCVRGGGKQIIFVKRSSPVNDDEVHAHTLQPTPTL